MQYFWVRQLKITNKAHISKFSYHKLKNNIQFKCLLDAESFGGEHSNTIEFRQNVLIRTFYKRVYSYLSYHKIHYANMRMLLITRKVYKLDPYMNT